MDERATSLTELTDELELATRSLVEATRRFSTGHWRRTARDHSIADRVQALVTLLAELEHAVEIGPGQRPPSWRSPSPAPYPGALPDRLAVVSNDLVAALRAAPDDWQVWFDGELVPVSQVASAALDEVRRAAS